MKRLLNITPPVAVYSATTANLANPENAIREVARLNNEIRKLKACLRRQTNNNSVQNQDYNLIPVNQPTCFICNKMGHLARHCKEEYQDPRISQKIIRNTCSGKTLLNKHNGETIQTSIRITNIGDLNTRNA